MLVKVYNTQYDRKDVYFFPVVEFNEYEGKEVSVKWAGAHELALMCDDSVGLRIIQRKNIRAIDGKPYVYSEGVAESITKIVKGSKGQDYTVTLGSKPTCTCPGFTYRGTCKHVTEATKSPA